jgi:nucleoside-diphosphate-sugar epimerase
MKAAISGSSGFIGSRLTEILKNQGHEVLPIPREVYYSTELIKFFTENKPDYIFHLAAYGNMAYQDDVQQTLKANLEGSINMIIASLYIPYKAFINVSSSSVLLPYETFYSATKASVERLSKAFINRFNSPIVTLRPYSVYGPNEAPFRFIPTVFRSCLEKEEMTLAPNSVHDWIYIDDFVDAMIYAAVNINKTKGKIYGVGTGVGTTNKDVVSLIEQITGKKANITKEQELRPFDNNKWTAQLEDYLCKTSLIEGLQRIYAKQRPKN